MASPAWPWLLAVGAAIVAGGGLVREAWGFLQGKALKIRLLQIAPGFELEESAARAFLKMASAAAAAGVSLVVNSAFRENAKQAELYALWLAGKGFKAAPPGYSNHQAGRDVDIETDGGTNAAFRWLTANAAAFGFQRTVIDEPHHWEYVA